MVKPGLVLLVGGAALLLLVLLLPSASATPTGATPIVAEVTRTVTTSAGGGISYDADINLTWKLSSNDPNQVSGSWQYKIVYDVGAPPNVWAGGVVPVPVAGRPGWVSHKLQVVAGSTGAVMPASDYNLTIVANDTGTATSSGYACIVSVDARTLLSQSQCESELAAPAGASIIVLTQANQTHGATAKYRWALSLDDPDQVNGTLEYWLSAGLDASTMYDLGPVVFDSQSFFSIGLQTTDVAGVRTATFTQAMAPQGTQPLFVEVLARDPLTRERSSAACQVFVRNGAIYEAGACGTLGVPVGGFVSGGYNFPFTDFDEMAEGTDMDPDLLAGLLAGLLVLGFASMGFVAAGLVGATVSALGSFGFAVALGLVPVYVPIVVFLLAMLIIVFAIKARGGAAE